MNEVCPGCFRGSVVGHAASLDLEGSRASGRFPQSHSRTHCSIHVRGRSSQRSHESGETEADPCGDGVHLLADILRTSPLLHAYDSFLFRATEISSTVRSGLHDCLYIALAERERCQFVTVDDKLLKTIQKDFPFVIHLGTL